MRDALARLTEELGDPFADPRPPKRYGPEADGRVTSLPGLADGEEGEGDVIAFYRKGQRIDVGKVRGSRKRAPGCLCLSQLCRSCGKMGESDTQGRTLTYVT